MSNVAICCRALSAMCVRSMRTPRRETMLLPEDEILGDRIVEHRVRARGGPPGMCDSPASPRAFTDSVGDVAAGDAIVPARDGAQSGDRLDQLRLPVAFDAGDAEDLARRDVEG